MSRTVKEKRARFRELHQSGCFILPNPWDVGSARMLESLGFEALASTSTGYAWSTGRPDYAVTRDDVLEHLTTLANSVNLPLNADFEAGFAPDLEGVTENVSRAIAVGVAGLSIEDRIVGESGLYDIATSVERLKAARAAIDQSGEDVILVAYLALPFICAHWAILRRWAEPHYLASYGLMPARHGGSLEAQGLRGAGGVRFLFRLSLAGSERC